MTLVTSGHRKQNWDWALVLTRVIHNDVMCQVIVGRMGKKTKLEWAEKCQLGENIP